MDKGGSDIDRSDRIVRYNLLSVGINLVLSVLKLIVGLSIHSMAILLDAANGLSDMLSSIISIAGTRAAGRKSDKLHPMGYGRLEYLSSLLITSLIMFVGAKAIWDSIQGILHQDGPPDYNLPTIVILVVSVACKIFYGILLRSRGKKLHSVALIMTGTEGMADALVSAGILAGIVVLRTLHIDVEPYLCIIISVMILFTGIGMLRESMSKIIGTRPDPAFEKEIKQRLVMEDGVLGVSNLVIHTYGENSHVGSVNIEVEGSMPAAEVTRLSRRLIRTAAELGLTLTSVGITGSNLDDPRAAEIWDTILDKARRPEYRDILQVQLFTMDFERAVISFYVLLDYASKSREETLGRFRADLEETFPGIRIDILTAIDI